MLFHAGVSCFSNMSAYCFRNPDLWLRFSGQEPGDFSEKCRSYLIILKESLVGDHPCRRQPPTRLESPLKNLHLTYITRKEMTRYICHQANRAMLSSNPGKMT